MSASLLTHAAQGLSLEAPDVDPGLAPQRTPAWHAARLGKVTASRLPDLVARTKTGWSASRGTYMAQLLVERLTGEPTAIPPSPAMRWGTLQERRALAAYSFRTDRDPLPTGFWDHPVIPGSGASPDGLVGLEGLVEVKCPNTSTHLETLAAGEIPAKYLPQMHWQMACTGRTWCDFVSFDPRLPEPLRLFVRRLERDADAILELEGQVETFLGELGEKVQALAPQALRSAA
jgi:putative phage-type endonuclease